MRTMALSSLLMLSLSFSMAAAQAAPLDVRALATLGGDDKSLLGMRYDPVQQQLFIADLEGYTLWSLNGMTQLTDYRTTAMRRLERWDFDFAGQQAYLRDDDHGYLIGLDRKVTQMDGVVTLFNKRVYVASEKLMVLDNVTQPSREVANNPRPGYVYALKALSDGNRFLVRTDDRVLLYSVSPGQLLKTFGPLGSVNGMRLAPDEETVALYNGQGAALFDLAIGLRLNDFPVGGDVFDAAFSPDGSLLALATKSTTLTVWDRETATVSTTVKPDDRTVSAVAFSPDGRTLAVGTESGPLFLFDSKTGERLAELRGHSSGVQQLVFTSDGRYLLSKDYGTVRVWGNPKASAFAAPASLTLASSTPGATAILDGTPLGNLDATGLTLTVAAEAPHLLKVVAPGRLPYAATLILKAGEKRVLTIDPSPLIGKATIQSTPTGANVIIDGKVAGKTPLTVENLPDGALDFRLKFAGYAEYAGQVTVQGGGAATATAALKELPGLNVKSNPVGATVLVDGQALGVTPLSASGLKPGKYVVTVRLKGFKDQTATVTIPESGKVNLDITLKK